MQQDFTVLKNWIGLKKKKKNLIRIPPQNLYTGLSKFKAQNSINKHSPILIGPPKITCGQKGNLGLAIRVLGFAHIYNQTLFHFVPSRLVSLCTSLLNRSNGARRFLPQLYALSFSEISFRSEIWFRVYYFLSKWLCLCMQFWFFFLVRFICLLIWSLIIMHWFYWIRIRFSWFLLFRVVHCNFS